AVGSRLCDRLSVEDERDAARIAALKALAAGKQHLGDLDRLKKLVTLTAPPATQLGRIVAACAGEAKCHGSGVFMTLIPSDRHFDRSDRMPLTCRVERLASAYVDASSAYLTRRGHDRRGGHPLGVARGEDHPASGAVFRRAPQYGPGGLY